MSADRWFSEADNLRAQGDFCAQRGDWRGAYRCYGTAAEFLLKAIYLKNTQRRTMPPEMQAAKSHDLTFVANAAGLGQAVRALTGPQRRYWLTVRDWDQSRRYPNEPFPARDGKDLKVALFNPNNGIWSWLLNHYQAT